jgi:pyridoxal phosphate enzyme (YggS family)
VIRQNIAAVEERIAKACARTGRTRSEITLVAVTKVFPAEAILEAYEAGLRDFGENYVQEFESKYERVRTLDGARFHLIGHLQSNKARRAAEIFDVIQTVDSDRLARRLNGCGRKLDVMIELKLSEEEAKSGASADQIRDLAEAIRQYEHLRLQGLMTMPPWSSDPEASRPYFARLRDLAASLRLTTLSMGMSHDFEVAIEEGATHIRVGTALFGKRRKP